MSLDIVEMPRLAQVSAEQLKQGRLAIPAISRHANFAARSLSVKSPFLQILEVPTEADASYRSQVGLHSIRMPMAAINRMVARQGSDTRVTILCATDRSVLADAVRSATL